VSAASHDGSDLEDACWGPRLHPDALDAGAFERETDREAIQEVRRALCLAPYMAEAHLLVGRLDLRGGRRRRLTR
jgi:hypothetical protein